MNRSTPASVGALIVLGVFPWLGGFYDGILGIGGFWGVLTVNPTGYHPHLSLWGENAIFSWAFFTPYSAAVVSATLGATTAWRDTWVTLACLSFFVLLSVVMAVNLELVPIAGLVAVAISWRSYFTSDTDESSPDDSLLEAYEDTSPSIITTTQTSVSESSYKEDYSTLVADLDEAARLAKNGDLQQARDRLTTLEMDILATEEIPDEEKAEYATDLDGLERRRQRLLSRVTDKLRQHRIPDVVAQSLNISVEYPELEINELLGSGSTADVFSATAPTEHGSPTIAIKRPHVQGTLHTEAATRILTEAERWNKIDDHGHIVGVIDWDQRPLPWIAMEYLDGGDLTARAGEMQPRQALWTAAKLADAVHHAHRNGVVHLDLKPENILFRSVADRWDIPKIADWGLSRYLIEQTHSVEGLTPQYAAPEQFDSTYGTVDDLTDIYQLGAVLYELFTGRPPFKGDQTAVMHSTLKESPTPPSQLAAVPTQVDRIILQCLAKQKSARPESAVIIRNQLWRLFKNS